MQSLNAYRFYELGAKLHGLVDNSTQRVADMFATLAEAQTLLDSLIKDETFPLHTSRADATRLLNKIGSLFDRYFIDPSTKQLKAGGSEDRVDLHELSLLRTLTEKFEHALAADMSHIPSYVAQKCGIYSTFELAENARNVFGANLRDVIPASALIEFDTAGRSLAFGLGTAASIHTLRAVEIMLRAYYESFAGSAAAKGERNYANYVKKLATMSEDEDKDPRPDRRIVLMLVQIKDQYRNPLVTPETVIEVEEAAQLFGIASNVVASMAREMKTRESSDDDIHSTKLTDEAEKDSDFPIAQAS